MLHICYSINDFFAREAGISLIGFFENNPDYEPEEVFILDFGIHALNRQRLDEIAARYGRRVTWLSPRTLTSEMKRQYPHLKAWRGTMAPNAKCFIEEIMPDYVERLLFIDADTVVAGSVAELSTLDMEGKALGVVPSSRKKKDMEKAKCPLASGNLVYFNSGVLLYNLPVWRSENCHQMIVDMLEKKINLDWPDQNLLNNAIPERLLKLLPLKFNYVTHMHHPRQEHTLLSISHRFTEEEIEEAVNHPAIIHYLGNGLARPWYEGCRSSHQEPYLRYKALSPWKDSPLTLSPELKNKPKDFQGKVWRYQLLLMTKPYPYWLVRALKWCSKKLLRGHQKFFSFYYRSLYKIKNLFRREKES